VTKVVDDDWLQVEIADGVRVVIAKGTISDVVSRGQPVKEPPTRSAGKKRPAARRAKPQESEEEPEEDFEGEEDASFDDDADDADGGDEAEANTDEEHEDDPEEIEERPPATKRGKKKAAS
jgi:hypothetical protein